MGQRSGEEGSRVAARRHEHFGENRPHNPASSGSDPTPTSTNIPSWPSSTPPQGAAELFDPGPPHVLGMYHALLGKEGG